MLKIIAGERRGAHLFTLEGLETRPLRGRVRESLFNILQGQVAGRHVLDLFAGSGAVGLEALSRGATSTTFVESEKPALDVIRKNIVKLKYEDRATIVAGRLPGALDGIKVPEGGFGLVIVMPPYHSEMGKAILEKLTETNLCSADCILVLEVHRDEPVPAGMAWTLEDDRGYGITRLTIWKQSLPQHSNQAM